MSSAEREAHQRNAAMTKTKLLSAGLPVMPSETHIVPVMVGDAERCKKASDLLLHEHGVYIQPINYPTVPRGQERLRITPTPFHDERLINELAVALVSVWTKLGLPRYEGRDEPVSRQTPVTGNARVGVFPPAGG
jgi:5-aminolevulinate synthase